VGDLVEVRLGRISKQENGATGATVRGRGGPPWLAGGRWGPRRGWWGQIGRSYECSHARVLNYFYIKITHTRP